MCELFTGGQTHIASVCAYAHPGSYNEPARENKLLFSILIKAGKNIIIIFAISQSKIRL